MEQKIHNKTNIYKKKLNKLIQKNLGLKILYKIKKLKKKQIIHYFKNMELLMLLNYQQKNLIINHGKEF